MAKRFQQVAIVPCGGSGARFGGHLPKQYLPLLDATVLHHTLAALEAVAAIEHVYVGVQPDDELARNIAAPFSRVSVLPSAGQTRSITVLQTLNSIRSHLSRDAWVLVHDAARPCVNPADIERLMTELQSHPVGGLLALPLTDTVKRVAGNAEVIETVDRSQLWRALTPQMFRGDTLAHALAAAPNATDESQAIEALGLSPKIIAGDASNLKITFPEDLQQAARILLARKTP